MDGDIAAAPPSNAHLSHRLSSFQAVVCVTGRTFPFHVAVVLLLLKLLQQQKRVRPLMPLNLLKATGRLQYWKSARAAALPPLIAYLKRAIFYPKIKMKKKFSHKAIVPWL